MRISTSIYEYLGLSSTNRDGQDRFQSVQDPQEDKKLRGNWTENNNKKEIKGSLAAGHANQWVPTKCAYTLATCLLGKEKQGCKGEGGRRLGGEKRKLT